MWLTKAQIDKLGERLRTGPPHEDDLSLLDEYRRSFGVSYQEVTRVLRDRLRLEPTGRTKSNISIIQKLRREPSIRLTQMQDIEGCRVVLPDVSAQDVHVISIPVLFAKTNVIDRRERPSHSYRAVHVVVSIYGQPVEIQVRTALQQLWAELSEKMADTMSDPSIKYGGGSAQVRQLLMTAAQGVATIESLERRIARLVEETNNRTPLTESGSTEFRAEVERTKEDIESQRSNLMSLLKFSMASLPHGNVKGDGQ